MVKLSRRELRTAQRDPKHAATVAALRRPKAPEGQRSPKAPASHPAPPPVPSTPLPQRLPEGALFVELGLDHNSIKLTTAGGREITLLNSEQGMAMLVQVLRTTAKRRGTALLSRFGQWDNLGTPIPKAKQYNTAGRRVALTLEDLGL